MLLFNLVVLMCFLSKLLGSIWGVMMMSILRNIMGLDIGNGFIMTGLVSMKAGLYKMCGLATLYQSLMIIFVKLFKALLPSSLRLIVH